MDKLAEPTESIPTATSELQSPGHLLRLARESKRLNIEQVAHNLHLSPQQIVELECDNYQEIPAPVYVRGYLRLYARLVGLSEQEIVTAFEKLNLPTREKITNAMQPRLEFEYHRPSFNRRWLPWLNVLIVVVLLALVMVWLSEKNNKNTVKLSAPTSVVDIPVSKETSPESSP